MSKSMWVVAPSKGKSSAIPVSIKVSLSDHAKTLINTVLAPRYIKPHSTTNDFNYVAELHTKWHGNKFYFCATYRCPGPDAIEPFFETKFARMEYVSGDRFNLSYMRHTGQWFEIESNLKLDQCLVEIEQNDIFMP